MCDKVNRHQLYNVLHKYGVEGWLPTKTTVGYDGNMPKMNGILMVQQ